MLHFVTVTNVPFPIHHTFGPLVTREQRRSAFRLQFQPWKWREGPEREEFRRELSNAFACGAALFGSGREALLAALRALELKPGEEVILQALTCVVVPNAIHAAQGSAVYGDIDPQTLNLDVEKIQRAITPRTRAIICQHTFGIPADTKRLRAICDKRNLLLIEDCAHVIPDGGAVRDGQMNLLRTAGAGEEIGRRGDILIMSFGRDKAISGVTGGAALTRHPAIARRLEQAERDALSLSPWLILNLLGYPLRYAFAKSVWRTGFAKAYLRAARAMGLLPPVLTGAERAGNMGIHLHRLPNACAALALEQFHTIAAFNDHRRRIAELYLRAAKEHGWTVPGGALHAPVLQKFPLFSPRASEIRAALKREQIYLDDGWCGAVVNPPSVSQDAAGYMAGSCPVAEDVARHLLMLPLHPTMTEAQARYLIHALRSQLSEHSL